MKFWAGVTDNEWFPFLASRGLDEVNFWRPSPGPYFTSLPAGTSFLFKLKEPYNHPPYGGLRMPYFPFLERNSAANTFMAFVSTVS